MFFSVITPNLSWVILTKWGQDKKEEGGDFEGEGVIPQGTLWWKRG